MINFNIIDILCCPECNTPFEELRDTLICPDCHLEFKRNDRKINLLPKTSKSNNFNMDYIEHYINDAKIFDYFEQRNDPATTHDELRLKQYVLSQIKDDNNVILDVGSGSAWIAKYLSDKNIVISLDISENNIQKALDKINSSNHYGIIADALNPPFKKNIFDYIVASEVIEHIVKPDEFITELSRLLKTNGELIITTPYKEKIHYSQCIHCNQLTPKNAHLHSFDENILTSFAKNNIIVEKIKIFGNKALLILRTHIILKYLPFTLWKLIDKLANIIIPKMNHILIIYKKNEI